MTFLTDDRGAIISDDGRHRYVLWRYLTTSESPRRIVFVGMNPSTADAQNDDPTIRRCMGFARDLGFDRMYMLNLFTFRATNPSDLPTGWIAADSAPEACGIRHREILGTYIGRAGVVVAAWGAIEHPWKAKAIELLLDAARAADKPLLCLGRTKNGDPRHPLYLPKTARPMPWSMTVAQYAALPPDVDPGQFDYVSPRARAAQEGKP